MPVSVHLLFYFIAISISLTLLGGKTAVNTPFGKNLIGAFHDPSLVICNIDFLKKLPQRHLCNGMAEVIKSAAIANPDLFDFCATHSDAIVTDRDGIALTRILSDSISIKANVVIADPNESSLRAILNFGHSIGHALESLLSPDLLHGEAVSIGMVVEAIVSRNLGFCAVSTIQRLISCLRLYHLPTALPDSISVDEVLRRISLDKKNAGGKKRVVMICEIGSVIRDPATSEVSDNDLSLALSPRISLSPSSHIDGRITVPGSKSVSNRILCMVALSTNTVKISGLLFSHDTLFMINALRCLGVNITIGSDEMVTVVGSGGKLQPPPSSIYLGNAGTVARFLTTMVALLPAHTSVVMEGCKRMHHRPIRDLVEGCRQGGVRIDYLDRDDFLPIRVYGGGFRGGRIELSAEISSQFVSSILMIAPYASNPVILSLTSKQVITFFFNYL